MLENDRLKPYFLQIDLENMILAAKNIRMVSLVDITSEFRTSDLCRHGPKMDAAHMPREEYAERIEPPHPWILGTFSYSVVQRFSYSVFCVHSFGLINLVILFIQYFCVYVDSTIQDMQT